jgi:HSP20 family molecular chaperone IbpA
MDAVAAGTVGCRLHHAALVAPPAHHQELDVAKLGVALAADFDEEGVEIDVEETGAYLDGPRAGDEAMMSQQEFYPSSFSRSIVLPALCP